MRFLCAALFLSLHLSALAGELTASYGENRVALSERPCTHAGTMARIKPEARESYRMARGMIGGQDFYGCWRPIEASVFVIWEDGEYNQLPMGDFTAGKPGI